MFLDRGDFDTGSSKAHNCGMAARNDPKAGLTDEQSAFVDDLVASGQYASAGDVVREGVRLLQEQRWRAEVEAHSEHVEKWFHTGELTEEEAAQLPPGFLDRVKARFKRVIAEADASGNAGALDDAALDALIARGRARPPRKLRA